MTTLWFLHEVTSEKQVQKFHTDDVPVPRSGYGVLLIGWKYVSFIIVIKLQSQ